MHKVILLLFSTVCLHCAQAPQAPLQAKLLGAEVISSVLPEFATSVDADQQEIFFNRTNEDRSVMQIMCATRQEQQWSPAEALPFSTGEYLDVDPFLTADGDRLYFSSTRPTEWDTGMFHTWYVERQDDSWSDPINPGPPLNSDSTEIFFSMAQNGNAYFLSERGGDRIIRMSRFYKGQYQEPEKITLKLRGEILYASNPCIASDERFLIVAARDPQGNGTPDLFVSWNQEGVWGELINLGEAVNSPYADFAPGLSKDDQTLYFTSERPGMVGEQAEGIRPPGDIYYVNLQAILSR